MNEVIAERMGLWSTGAKWRRSASEPVRSSRKTARAVSPMPSLRVGDLFCFEGSGVTHTAGQVPPSPARPGGCAAGAGADGVPSGTLTSSTIHCPSQERAADPNP